MRVFGIIILLLISSQAYAAIYKWVDGQGLTHYGEKPPANIKSKQIQLRRESASSTSPGRSPHQPTDTGTRLKKQQKLIRALSADRKEKQEQQEKQQRMEKQRIRNCAMSKDNLRRYESSSAVYKVDDKGKRIILPSAERDKSIGRARAEVKKWCTN